MNLHEILILLIRISVLDKRNVELYLSPRQWEILFLLSETQGIHEVTYDAITKLAKSDIPSDILQAWRDGCDPEIEKHRSEPVDYALDVVNHVMDGFLSLEHVCNYIMVRNEIDTDYVEELGLTKLVDLLDEVCDHVLYGYSSPSVDRFMKLLWTGHGKIFLLKFCPGIIIKRWTNSLKIKNIWTN